MKQFKYIFGMTLIEFMVALVIMVLLGTWSVSNASPQPLNHEAPMTTEWAYYEEITTESRHHIAGDSGILMPYAVGVVCSEQMRAELVVRRPANLYPDVWLAAYIEGVADTDQEGNETYAAYFTAENSFGGFNYEDMYVRLRDWDDPTKPYTGDVCTAAWFYTIPVQEFNGTYPAGCTSAWSEDCS